MSTRKAAAWLLAERGCLRLRLMRLAAWARRQAKRLLPLISVCLIYAAVNLVRVGAAAALISIPVAPAYIAVRAWGTPA
jgi:hypothetical protein